MLDFEIVLGPFRLRFSLSAPVEEVEGDVLATGDVFSTIERATDDSPIYEDRAPIGFRGR